ncbi:MAG: hypothetical protein OHK0039_34150 [Bacteroidia bacterium]
MQKNPSHHIRNLLLSLMLVVASLPATQAAQHQVPSSKCAAGVSAPAMSPHGEALWALGAGLFGLLGAGATILIALACFGGCPAWVVLLPVILFTAAGVAAVVLGIGALARREEKPHPGLVWKAIVGLVTGLASGGFGLYALVAMLLDR